MKNIITDVTRQHIADEMSIRQFWYHGNHSELDFLARLFDLKNMPSTDGRYRNAYDDIHKHMVMNTDWDSNWIYSDPRINLLYCDDEAYLKFLSTTLHPIIRTNTEEVANLIEIYNKHLSNDGFEIVQTDEISGKPLFSGRIKMAGSGNLVAKKTAIKQFLNTSYVNGKINTMNDAIEKDTDLAIGTGKELLEIACRSILKQKGASVDPNWTLPQLLKAATMVLDFKPKTAPDPDKAERAIRQILQGIASITHGLAELRNGYGTGHGKDPDFKGLEPKYARLFVGMVSEIVLLYLATSGETVELTEF